MPDDPRSEDRPRKRRPDPDDDDTDDDDDRPRRKRRRNSAPDDGGLGYVIPYKNVPALIGYYVGVFGLFACFLFGLSLFTGAAAVVLGVMGMIRASKNPEAHGRAHAIIGIVLGILQVLTACIGWGIFWGSMVSSMGKGRH
jgi:hypothetical protein